MPHECGACSRNCPVEALSVKSGVGTATAVINLHAWKEESVLLLHRTFVEIQPCAGAPATRSNHLLLIGGAFY